MDTREEIREEIIELINSINDVHFLKFMCKLIKSFKRKWGV